MLFQNDNFETVVAALRHEFWMLDKLYNEREAPPPGETINQRTVDEGGRFAAIYSLWNDKIQHLLQTQDQSPAPSEFLLLIHQLRLIVNSIESERMRHDATRLLFIVEQGCEQIQQLWNWYNQPLSSKLV